MIRRVKCPGEEKHIFFQLMSRMWVDQIEGDKREKKPSERNYSVVLPQKGFRTRKRHKGKQSNPIIRAPTVKKHRHFCCRSLPNTVQIVV